MTKPENNYKERCADCAYLIEDDERGWICDLDGSLCEDVEICRLVDEYYEPDDLEMGYDPYLGCYTDDV